jgi:Family of unknown function (DUF6174)
MTRRHDFHDEVRHEALRIAWGAAGSVMRGLATAIALVLLSGCEGAPSRDVGEYRERLEAWQQSGPSNYRWTLVFSEPLFGPQPMTVVVRDGVPVRARSRGEDLEIDGDQVGQRPGTVEALIDWLIRYAPEARSVNVEWASAGYPSSIDLDLSEAIDDEVSYRVMRFEARGPAA